jgi:adenylate kinase family enzyme
MDSLIIILRNKYSLSAGTVISIDGFDGSGKSFLASRIAEYFKFQHIKVDDYIEKNKGAYVDCIKTNELKPIIKLLLSKGVGVTVDGVCVNKVMDMLSMPAGIKIYVKKVTHNWYWHEVDKFNRDITADEVIEKEESMTKMVMDRLGKRDIQEYMPMLTKEIIKYHYEYWPHESADIIFERQE